MFLLFLLSGEFLIINGCWILSKAFSASIEIIIQLLFFNLLMWYITLIDLWILKNPCIFLTLYLQKLPGTEKCSVKTCNGWMNGWMDGSGGQVEGGIPSWAPLSHSRNPLLFLLPVCHRYLAPFRKFSPIQGSMAENSWKLRFLKIETCCNFKQRKWK